jgi:hypothetical protein
MKINLNLEKNIGFIMQIYAQSFVQDFLGKYAYKWVTLFYDNPNMIFLNPVFFLKEIIIY